ncbi:MAG: acyl carrier protein [bacterium]|nr:acyl carrier protein [bacterium]
MSDEMRDQIIEFVQEEYVEDEDMEINDTSPLISSGLVDSFSMVSLKMFLEEEYHIKMADEDATTEAFDTVASIVKLVESIQARG